MRLRVTNPDLTSYDLEKVADHPKLDKKLRQNGILGWHYNWGADFIDFEVADDFDRSKLAPYGTVEEVVEDDVGTE